MNAVIAGWVAGYVMGVLSTIALTFLITRVRDASFVERWVARDVPGMLLAVPLFTGAIIGWTIIGLIFGSLYRVAGFDDMKGALGSPSLPFTLLVFGVGWLPLPPLIAIRRKYSWLWVSMTAAFWASFGWLLPLLAER